MEWGLVLAHSSEPLTFSFCEALAGISKHANLEEEEEEEEKEGSANVLFDAT